MSSMTPSTFRVMFVINNLGRAGAQVQLINIASGLAQRGWDVTVVSLATEIDCLHRMTLEDYGVTALSLHFPDEPRWRKVFRARKLSGVIKHYRPHVLVGFTSYGIMATRLTGRLSSVPVVISSIRGQLSTRSLTVQNLIYGLTDRLCDAMVTMSTSLAGELQRARAAAASHTHVIPNCVDAKKFNTDVCRPEFRRELGIDDDHFLWLAAGRLVEQKDYPNLLHAFSILSENWPNAKLVIAGEGEQRDEITTLIRQLHLRDRVQLLGLRADMPELYSACDAFVLSSAWEGVANAVLEAMASKRPVVTTTAGGMVEVVRDGLDGFVVPIQDYLALGKAMGRIMSLPDSALAGMGDSAYNLVLKELSPSRIVDLWDDLFKNMLNKKGILPSQV